MSDQSQGPGWWLASDGKWYPPEQAPGAAPTAPTEPVAAVPPTQPVPPVGPPAGPPPGMAPAGPPPGMPPAGTPPYVAPVAGPPASGGGGGKTGLIIGIIVVLLLIGGGIAFALTRSSSTDTAATTTTTSASTTTTKAEEETTTTKKAGTTTTKKGPNISNLTTTTRGKGGNVDRIIESQKKSAEDAGVEFTDAETECMATYISDNPEVEELDNPTTVAEWELVFGMIASCIEKEKFVDLSLGTVTGLTTTQKACLKEQMMTLSVEQFAGLAAQDPAIMSELTPLFQQCASA